jgi:hypothetical protein
VTIEISNRTPLPAKIYANEGIAQILFLLAVDVCRVSCADKRGKYQDQKDLTLPFIIGGWPAGRPGIFPRARARVRHPPSATTARASPTRTDRWCSR